MHDVIVIGAGIAGVSVAARIAQTGRKVLILEAEERPAYHTTGRSAALFDPNYGNAVIRALTAASRDFYETPPDGFSEVPLVRPRAVITVARADQHDALARAYDERGGAAKRIAAATAERLVPILRPGYVAEALLEDHGGDIDVDAIFQGFLRSFRKAGGQLVTDARIHAIRGTGEAWTVEAGGETYMAPILVNAAGAWADQVAGMAGLAPLGLTPLRRTVVLLPAPEGHAIADWPVVIDADEDFYFKPDAGALLLSPAEETPSEPCDAQAEEIDVAIAVDRFERATTQSVRRITHRWAGLRTFAPDRTPIVGFDPRTQGFFWLAGQGGYGVQTSPGLSALAADLVCGTNTADPRAHAQVPALAPQRFLAKA